jgi:hypothetical protein
MTNRIPITRLSKFFGEKDFDLNISIGEEWLMGDMNFTVVLYRVDRLKTNQDDVYGEALTNSISYLPPVEIKAYIKIESPTQPTFGNSNLSQSEPGNLIMSVYLKTLQDEGIEINYGDYIGYYETENRVRYYTVNNDGRVVSDNKHTYAGYKPFYRTIMASYVTDNEFRGL